LEHKLFEAARDGRVGEVLFLLRNHPDLNVNWANEHNFQQTALHTAAFYNHTEVVKVLLAHPRINVNQTNMSESTPLLDGCFKGNVSVVQVLLKDPRVNATLEDDEGCTPLWMASCYGHLEVIEWLIASGRDLGDVKNKKGKDRFDHECTALEIARRERKTEVVTLLERLVANPAQTRHEIRGKLAGEIFALTIFLCDGLLQFKPALGSSNHATTTTTAIRFIAIISKVPMELQMVQCHRVVGSMRQSILRKES